MVRHGQAVVQAEQEGHLQHGQLLMLEWSYAVLGLQSQLELPICWLS